MATNHEGIRLDALQAEFEVEDGTAGWYAYEEALWLADHPL